MSRQSRDRGLVLAPITLANGLAFVPVGRSLEVIDSASGETITVLPADAPVAGAAAISHGHVFFGSGLSYYDRGAELQCSRRSSRAKAATAVRCVTADRWAGCR